MTVALFNDPRHRSFVLIATYGRSGSTVLQSLLGAQPGWCIRGENYHTLEGLFESARRAHRTRSDFGRRAASPDNPWYGAHAVDPDSYARSLARAFVGHVLNPPPTAHVVGFKEVRLFHRISLAPELFDFVLGVFAPARIVFLQRAWHEISGSGWWPALDPDDVRSYVQRCDAVMDEYALRRPDRATVVRYTDLVHRRETVRELLTSCGPSTTLRRSTKSSRSDSPTDGPCANGR